MPIFNFLKKLKDAFKRTQSEYVAPIEFYLNEEQIKEATVWMINHPNKMLSVKNTKAFIPPKESHLSSPEMWNDSNWSWFLKALQEKEGDGI